MGWGPFGAPGWGYDMVSPPGPNLLSGPTALAPCVCPPPSFAGAQGGTQRCCATRCCATPRCKTADLASYSRRHQVLTSTRTTSRSISTTSPRCCSASALPHRSTLLPATFPRCSTARTCSCESSRTSRRARTTAGPSCASSRRASPASALRTTSSARSTCSGSAVKRAPWQCPRFDS